MTVFEKILKKMVIRAVYRPIFLIFELPDHFLMLHCHLERKKPNILGGKKIDFFR